MNANERLERDLYRIATARSDGFAGLARVAGLNPLSDFVDADLKGCDLSNQDLRAFDFRGADLRQCRFYKTLFLRKHVRGALFSSRKGFSILDDERSSAAVPTTFHIADLGYLDAITSIIDEMSRLSDVDQKRNLLKGVAVADKRESIRRFINGALKSEKALARNSISIPYLMNEAISQVYPLARGNLVQSFVDILGRNKDARSYLRYYRDKRARGPRVTAVLQEYLKT